MSRITTAAVSALVLTSVALLVPCPLQGEGVQVFPPRVELHGHFARCQLVVRQPDDAGADDESAETLSTEASDVTGQVQYESLNPAIVAVDARGTVLALSDGQTEVRLRLGDFEQRVPVVVSGTTGPPQIAFREQVTPILSKMGCNAGECHASQYGKGGFVLSVFGFDPEKDYVSIVRDRQQRRVSLNAPEDSLVLLKPCMDVPHGGGLRLEKNSVDYQILRAWLACGAPRPQADAAVVQSLSVTPNRRLIRQPGATQQLRVDATYSDGTVRDVTAWAKFDALDDAVVQVDQRGQVSTVGRGQSPVMVRFEGQAAISMFVVPYTDSIQIADWTSRNFVDELALAKFQQIGIQPSGLCDDATFLRRAFLDATGSVPTIEETRAFLESGDPDKREHLVDRLLGLTGDPSQDIYNDRYAAYWTLKWSDLIRNTSGGGQVEQAMWALHNWLKEAFRTNRPFDEMVAELVTAKGSIYMSGPANYFRINRASTDLAESTAQLFLGVRLQCAKCHHHPFEKYSQADYYRFAAFFARVGTKNSQEFGLFGRESVVMVRSSGEVRHPRTGQTMEPTPLDGEPVDHPLDRRIPLAEWFRSPENTLFAQSVVNRYVSYLLGRGLVDPVDDLRATNPPSNVPLMDALTENFIQSGFDIKQLIRVIMVSRLYQLDSQPHPDNVADRKFYSYFRAKRLAAEPLLDAVDYATSVQTKFQNLPLGTAAVELPDAEYPNYFLNTFAKPKRASVCECERVPDENLAQALHTLNGDILASKIAHKDGRIAQRVQSGATHEAIVEELYLAALCRYPSAAERELAQQFLEQSPSPTECYQDLLWALLNSKQFLFVH